MDIPSIKVYGE